MDEAGTYVRENIERKVLREGTMPMGQTISAPERAAIPAGIEREFKETWISWLTQVKCGASTVAPPEPEGENKSSSVE